VDTLTTAGEGWKRYREERLDKSEQMSQWIERNFPETKPSNPKDAIGSTKLPMHLIPGTALAHLSLAFLEGALKYGKFNWRVAGVRASIYLDAMKRHIEKWENGDDCDPETLVNHLSSVMACCAIVLDASLCGKLTDDRPPKAPVGGLIDALAVNVKHLQDLFAGHSPHHHTITDNSEG